MVRARAPITLKFLDKLTPAKKAALSRLMRIDGKTVWDTYKEKVAAAKGGAS